MAIHRIRVAWTGFPGAPGVSTFYSLNPASDVPLLHGFFSTLENCLPADVTIQVEGSGDVLDETTGDLTGAWSTDIPEYIQGVVGGGYAAPAGVCIIWETGAIMDSSRLRGKTYIVPTAALVYQTDGSIDPSWMATITGAAASLAAESNLVVWHRPRAARAADGSRPAVTARSGGYASISGATVHDKIAVLTSRRD